MIDDSFFLFFLISDFDRTWFFILSWSELKGYEFGLNSVL